MSIGSRIKDARKAKRITQETLALSVGITKGSVANYENSVSVPKVDVLFRLMSALGVDANYLYQDSMERGSADSCLSPDERSIVDIYRQLNEEGQDKITGILDDLVQSGKYKKHNSFF